MNEEEKKAIERIDYIQDFIIENGQYNVDVNDMECFSKILILIEKQQKEIEDLKDFISKLQATKDRLDAYDKENTFKIEKQQKEIEELKQVEQAHKEENGKLRVELEKEKNKNKVIEIFRKDMPKDTEIICMRKEDFERNFKSDYISKDKIREKIKELNKKSSN